MFPTKCFGYTAVVLLVLYCKKKLKALFILEAESCCENHLFWLRWTAFGRRAFTFSIISSTEKKKKKKQSENGCKMSYI